MCLENSDLFREEKKKRQNKLSNNLVWLNLTKKNEQKNNRNSFKKKTSYLHAPGTPKRTKRQSKKINNKTIVTNFPTSFFAIK